eukprot:SAG31_NODE_5399_length_2555_cov_1.499797_3_plen_141_part_00
MPRQNNPMVQEMAVAAGGDDDYNGPMGTAAAAATKTVDLLESEYLTRLICYVCYGVYIVLGLVMLLVGVLYYSSNFSSHAYIELIMGICGGCMVLMGGAALFANFKLLWEILAGVQLTNFVLILVLLMCSLIGIFLGVRE